MRILLGIIAFLCVLVVPASAGTMQDNAARFSDHSISVLAKPDCDVSVNAARRQDSTEFLRNHEELQRVRIELLERGFNPGFDAEGNGEVDNQLLDAIAQFQCEYDLPVTGQIDGNTLAALSVPIRKSNPTDSEAEIKRAKPSKSK